MRQKSGGETESYQDGVTGTFETHGCYTTTTKSTTEMTKERAAIKCHHSLFKRILSLSLTADTMTVRPTV